MFVTQDFWEAVWQNTLIRSMYSLFHQRVKFSLNRLSALSRLVSLWLDKEMAQNTCKICVDFFVFAITNTSYSFLGLFTQFLKASCLSNSTHKNQNHIHKIQNILKKKTYRNSSKNDNLVQNFTNTKKQIFPPPTAHCCVKSKTLSSPPLLHF